VRGVGVKGIVGLGWTDFSSIGFKKIEEELSFLKDIEVEYKKFEPSFVDRLHLCLDYKIPTHSSKSNQKDANHVIFLAGGKKMLEFLKRGGFKMGVIHENLEENDFERIEFVLFRRHWITKKTSGFLGVLINYSYIILLFLSALMAIIFAYEMIYLGTIVSILLGIISYCNLRNMERVWNLS
jgi:hypothetical protein